MTTGAYLKLHLDREDPVYEYILDRWLANHTQTNFKKFCLDEHQITIDVDEYNKDYVGLIFADARVLTQLILLA